MGLTGVITEATLRLLPIETRCMLVDTERVPDLDDVDGAHGRGRRPATTTRSRGSTASRPARRSGAVGARPVATTRPLDDAAAGAARRDPLHFAPRDAARRAAVGAERPAQPLHVRAFNELWYRKAPLHQIGHLETIGDVLPPARRRPRLEPPLREPRLRAVPVRRARRRDRDRARDARACSATRAVPSFLAVLKRFGPGNPGPLSFPTPGWTLALDIPASVPGLARLLDELDELVVEAGGRVYLAKDSRLRPELLPRDVPRLDRFRELRAPRRPRGSAPVRPRPPPRDLHR